MQAEEIAVEMEGVDEIELGDVHHVQAHELAEGDRDGVLLVVESQRVDGVHLVLAVEVRVEGIHDHDQLASRRSAALGIDEERAVQSLVDVPLDWHGVAVVQVQPERLGVELVEIAAARRDHLERAIHVCRVDAVEVHGMRMAAAVREVDAQPVPFRGADRRPGDLAVVRPRRIEHARRYLDLRVLGVEAVFAQRLPARQRGHLAAVEVREEGRRVEGAGAPLPNGVHLVVRAVRARRGRSRRLAPGLLERKGALRERQSRGAGGTGGAGLQDPAPCQKRFGVDHG